MTLNQSEPDKVKQRARGWLFILVVWLRVVLPLGMIMAFFGSYGRIRDLGLAPIAALPLATIAVVIVVEGYRAGTDTLKLRENFATRATAFLVFLLLLNIVGGVFLAIIDPDRVGTATGLIFGTSIQPALWLLYLRLSKSVQANSNIAISHETVLPGTRRKATWLRYLWVPFGVCIGLGVVQIFLVATISSATIDQGSSETAVLQRAEKPRMSTADLPPNVVISSEPRSTETTSRKLTTSSSDIPVTERNEMQSTNEQADLLFWASIKDSTDPADFAAYLSKFPRGHFTELATLRRGRLLKQSSPPEPATQASQNPRSSTAIYYNAAGEASLQVGKDNDAVKFFRIAAEQGHAGGQFQLGLMYAAGRGGLQKDEVQAAEWFRKAAEQGHAYSQTLIAVMLAEGKGGLPRDEAQAAQWYRKAAEQGNAAAQNNLADMYENGRGELPKDRDQAISWYRRAANQGLQDARESLQRLETK